MEIFFELLPTIDIRSAKRKLGQDNFNFNYNTHVESSCFFAIGPLKVVMLIAKMGII